MSTLPLKKNPTLKVNLHVLPHWRERQVLLSHASSSWYRCWHHGSVTLGDLDFVLSARAWWKSGLLALQREVRRRNDVFKNANTGEALSLLDIPAGFVCSWNENQRKPADHPEADELPEIHKLPLLDLTLRCNDTF